MTLHEHHRIDDDEDIPKLCQMTFFTREGATKVGWTILSAVVILVGSAVTYAITQAAAVARLDEKVITVERTTTEISRKYANIDNKLDTLISILKK